MSLSPPGVRLFYDPRGHHAGAINELCWGLEEQGVPCQTITYDGGGDAAALGALAARSSPLRVGIGLSASGEIALTHAQLPGVGAERTQMIVAIGDVSGSQRRVRRQ
ncbi:glycerol dehydratase reactivase beta/small subunit family protein, partial [Klebsiella pneumoniae]|nr:glycerol dehydratase reactivase beta/small subunit family protein [Klebsiella pneumoniae]